MKETTGTVYDCDTSPYWCSDEAYNNNDKTFGSFKEDGQIYEISDPETPRPWLNYVCNLNFASCISNKGMGFTWFKTSLLRVTRYDHEIDYLPRQFRDGRNVIIKDLKSGKQGNVFADGEVISCIHRPGSSLITARWQDYLIKLTIFVPVEDSGECWLVEIMNESDQAAEIEVSLEQVWAFALFGVHTAEEGIPYLSTPGTDLQVLNSEGSISCHAREKALPVPLTGIFHTPDLSNSAVEDICEKRKDGRKFTFKKCRLFGKLTLNAGDSDKLSVFSGADDNSLFAEFIQEKYTNGSVFTEEFAKVNRQRQKEFDVLNCNIPEKNLQYFLNTWFKNQLFLTFRFVRSGIFGYRDTMQDTWGYTPINPQLSRQFLLRTLSHIRTDGFCPRGYSVTDDKHDLRLFMDSGTWIAQTLADYVKESGDTEILNEEIPWLDSDDKHTVAEHISRVMNLLFEKRGRFGLCLTGDGDWNDALEGISRSGDAVSAWLTMALYHAQNLLAGLFAYLKDTKQEDLYKQRSEVLKECINTHAWDGSWYVYGFTGSGKPIGSHKNNEGRIHLNAQTWAVFTGLADSAKTESIRQAISKHLDSRYGPALLSPPYVDEADEVGRIANLQPGTFENGSIYQHAVSFKIFADFCAGDPEAGLQAFLKLLPTNPDNSDCRRTSEPYCTGNYYCGPGHPRFGQNFFTWFTGNAAWLLRCGFEQLLGIKPDFKGLKISPQVPSNWQSFSVQRRFRNTVYNFKFQRAGADFTAGTIICGGKEYKQFLPLSKNEKEQVLVYF